MSILTVFHTTLPAGFQNSQHYLTRAIENVPKSVTNESTHRKKATKSLSFTGAVSNDLIYIITDLPRYRWHAVCVVIKVISHPNTSISYTFEKPSVITASRHQRARDTRHAVNKHTNRTYQHRGTDRRAGTRARSCCMVSI